MLFEVIEINRFFGVIVQYMSEESERLSSWYSLSSAKLSSYVSSIDPSPLRMIGRRLSLESELQRTRTSHGHRTNHKSHT